MVRLVAWTLAAAALTLGALGCDSGGKTEMPPPPPTNGRSNAVAAKSVTAAAVTVAHVAAPAPTGPARQLCAGQTPRPAPRAGVKTAAAPGVDPPPAVVPFGVGKWVWVNLWAAWCEPCKQEMPRLLAWKEKLAAAGVLLDLAFVSMDDDERQLKRFLEQQTAGGVRASYWLPDGDLRKDWLIALGLKETTELPVHALVAPSGQVTCMIQGGVEDRDYPALAAFLGAKK